MSKPLANEEMKRVTIYSVAHEAGVSLATVSRVINGSDVVRAETKQKVQDAIVRLGYKPNAIAQGLALKKTTTIALVVPDSSFLYIGKTINGLLDVAKIYRYNILLQTSTSGINEMNEIIDTVIKSRVDGMIVYNDRLSGAELEALKTYGVPIVFLGSHVTGDTICCVYFDYAKACCELVSRYLDKGIDDIVLVQDRQNPIIMEQILKGVKKAYADHGKQFDEAESFLAIPEAYHTSYAFLSDHFKDHRHQLVLAYRDSQALAVLNSATENGIKVPQDMEIVCVLDSRYTTMVRPQLSSFEIPSYDAGALAMRIMTKMLSGEEIKDAARSVELNYIYSPKKTTK